MALPLELENQAVALGAVATDIGAITATIAALPDPPLEADLPAIVTIVSDLTTAAQTMSDTVTAMITTLRKVRITQ